MISRIDIKSSEIVKKIVLNFLKKEEDVFSIKNDKLIPFQCLSSLNFNSPSIDFDHTEVESLASALS